MTHTYTYDRPVGTACRTCGSATKQLRLVGPRAGYSCRGCDRDQRLAQSGRTAANRRMVVYGLHPQDYVRLVAAQGGSCAICRRGRDGYCGSGRKRRALAVDHDHLTGRVRGLVCSPCNDILAYLKDNPSFFVNGAKYLENPPAKQLNIVAISLD